MPVAYRLATVSDAAAIARLHVASWRETYTGLLLAAMLADLSAGSRAAMWEAVLDAPARRIGTRVHLAEEEGEVVGFGACGGQRDEGLRDRGFVGEFGVRPLVGPRPESWDRHRRVRDFRRRRRGALDVEL